MVVMTEDEWKQYEQAIKTWRADQIQDELSKLYTELVAGIIPQVAYEKARELLESYLYGAMYGITPSPTSDDDYDRAMKGI